MTWNFTMTRCINDNKVFMNLSSKFIDLLLVFFINLLFSFSSINQKSITIGLNTMSPETFVWIYFNQLHLCIILSNRFRRHLFLLFRKHSKIHRKIIIVKLARILCNLQVHMHFPFRQLLITFLLLNIIFHNIQRRQLLNMKLFQHPLLRMFHSKKHNILLIILIIRQHSIRQRYLILMKQHSNKLPLQQWNRRQLLHLNIICQWYSEILYQWLYLVINVPEWISWWENSFLDLFLSHWLGEVYNSRGLLYTQLLGKTIVSLIINEHFLETVLALFPLGMRLASGVGYVD